MDQTSSVDRTQTPARYVHGHAEPVLRSHTWRTAANSAAHLLPHLRAGDRLLDVGCGPGTITADLAAVVAPGRTVGVDVVEQVLDAARARCVGLDVPVEFVTAPAEALPFDDGAFDVVHAHQVLQHVADPVQVLREMRRVCRPGGLVSVRESDYRAFTWYPRNPGLEAWGELYQQVARADGGEPDAGRRLLSWARRAGFEHVEPGASTWCYADPERRAWWGGLWADRVLASRFGERALELGLTDRAGLERVAEAWRTWAADPDGWIVIVHGEVLCRA